MAVVYKGRLKFVGYNYTTLHAYFSLLLKHLELVLGIWKVVVAAAAAVVVLVVVVVGVAVAVAVVVV